MTRVAPPFDLLLSAELLVADATATLEVLVDRLGIEPPRDSWRQRWPGWGFEAYWCRVGADLATSPTRLEVISPYGTADAALDHPHMHEIFDAQRDRPARAHSTPIVVADVGALADELASRDVCFRLDPPSDELPFPRLWIGFSDDGPITYRPDADAGLRLEFLPTAAIGLPAGAAELPATDAGPPDGRFVGIAARIFTTDDLDATVTTLRGSFDWSPSAITTSEGGRRASYGFAFPRSGALEVVEPASGTREAAYQTRWGSGPYGIRLAVNGVSAKADDLADRGTSFESVDRGGRQVLLVDPEATTGTQFEIGESSPVTS